MEMNGLYEKEFKRYPYLHQTLDNGREFVCFAEFGKGEVKTFDTHLHGVFSFCPFCGGKLGERIEAENGYKFFWQDIRRPPFIFIKGKFFELR